MRLDSLQASGLPATGSAGGNRFSGVDRSLEVAVSAPRSFLVATREPTNIAAQSDSIPAAVPRAAASSVQFAEDEFDADICLVGIGWKCLGTRLLVAPIQGDDVCVEPINYAVAVHVALFVRGIHSEPV